MSYTEEIINRLKCPFKAEDLTVDTGRVNDGTETTYKEFWVKVIHEPSGKSTYQKANLPQKELLEHALYDLKEKVSANG